MTLFANGVQVGHTEAGSDGSWSITANKLAQGTYAITAQAIDQFGQTTSPIKTLVPNLVVDTAPPVITSLSFNRFDGTLTVTFQDNLSGMDLRSITNSSFYHISATPLSSKVHPPKLILPTSISYTPGALPSDPVVVYVVFNKGHSMRGGNYAVIINAGTGDKGIQDVAGNALDGNYFGTFPSGDGLAGGDFVATIATFHNLVYAGVPILDGYVPPAKGVDPPAGSSKTVTTKKLVTTRNTAPVQAPASRLVASTAVHDKALLAIIAELEAGAAGRNRGEHGQDPACPACETQRGRCRDEHEKELAAKRRSRQNELLVTNRKFDSARGECWGILPKRFAWPVSGMVQKWVTASGGWGRRPEGDAPRSKATALGARRLLPARPQPPIFWHPPRGGFEPGPVS